MRKINMIVLHCTATIEGKDYSVDTIRQWHLKRGFKDIGYHYIIHPDGKIEAGRKEEEVGAHTVGQNANSIGISYVGGLDAKTKKAKDTRTDEQKIALYELVYKLLHKYNLTIYNVHCHYEFANKACPCYKREDFIKEYVNWESERK